jgi:protein involved in polysaccharide export with SLBB domain
VVNVSEPGPKIFVIGEVFLPQALALKIPATGPDETLTVSLAVAMAGGTLRNADLEKVSVVRQMKDNQKLIISVNLKLVSKLLAEDILLQENDIVYVPNKPGMKKLGIICIFRGSLSSVPYIIR